MAEVIIKDVKQIYSSIFDHKPVLHREVNYFVQQFEETRKDREVDRLFRTLELVTDLKDSEISKSYSLADIHLPKLQAELQVAESISDKLIHKRSTADHNALTTLQRKRQERAKEWDTFVHEMTNKCIRIDSSYSEKQEKVRTLYHSAEERLLTKAGPTDDQQ